jgi:mitochondrial fission protein ELM1
MPDPAPSAAVPLSPLQVWLITDDKPGHRNQLEGLLQALQRRCTVDAHWLRAPAHGQSLLCGLRKQRLPGTEQLPAPDLILVAGHRTHWAGLAARRAAGGKLVCLMRPSLPARLFDACVVPWHDQPPHGGHILRTLGVLNPMRPCAKTPGSCAILIGGVSRHFGWNDDTVLWAVNELLQQWPNALVTDSRRTPHSLRSRLAMLASQHGCAYHAWEHCPPGWLADTLAITETAWITTDSVSMVYEALTAGCATGLIELPPQRGQEQAGKVAQGLDRLLAEQRVTRLSDYLAQHAPLPQQPEPLAEADAVAAQLLKRWNLLTPPPSSN